MATSAEAVKFIKPTAPPLDERSKYLRKLVVRALEGGERGHIGSSMSLIEIMRVLYDDILRYRPSEPAWHAGVTNLPRTPQPSRHQVARCATHAKAHRTLHFVGAPSSNSQNHPPGIAASYHIERGIDFIQCVFMGDDAIER